MKIPLYFDARDLAQTIGGFSAMERMIEEEREQRERLLRFHAAPAIDDILSSLGGLSAIKSIVARERTEREREFDSYRQLVDPSQQFDLAPHPVLGSLSSAVETARLAGSLALPDLLDHYRIADLSLAARLADAHRMSWWDDLHLEELNAHSALSGMLDGIGAVGRDSWEAIDSVLSDPLIGLDSVRQAREFLDITGLLRFPRFRTLTIQEKRRRVKRLIRENALPAPVKKAQGLVHRYEKLLRVLIAQCMEDAYGADWAEARLPLCDCKKLLGKSLEGDESVLDHADYKHYELIMCHDEHFETVFAAGYTDSDELRRTIARLGQLRARSHHGRTFTAEDLRELTALWRAMEAGFEGLIDEVVDP